MTTTPPTTPPAPTPSTYLIHIHGVGAIIKLVARDTSADRFGEIQLAFSKRTGVRKPEYAEMICLCNDQKTSEGLLFYDSELAGSAGASYRLIAMPHNTDDEVSRAKAELRRKFDVVSLRVVRIQHLLEWTPPAPGSIKYHADGTRLTDCCGAMSTYMDAAPLAASTDAVLCCKTCAREVPMGQGDGNEWQIPWTAEHLAAMLAGCGHKATFEHPGYACLFMAGRYFAFGCDSERWSGHEMLKDGDAGVAIPTTKPVSESPLKIASWALAEARKIVKGTA